MNDFSGFLLFSLIITVGMTVAIYLALAISWALLTVAAAIVANGTGAIIAAHVVIIIVSLVIAVSVAKNS